MMERNEILLAIGGEPFGKERPRVVRRGKGCSRAYTPAKTVAYEKRVKMAYRDKYGRHISFGTNDELHLDIKAFYGISKSTPKYLVAMMLTGIIKPNKKPDIDNIIKIVADSLNSVAYKDDKQIVACSCQKFYASVPRVEISLSKINKVSIDRIKEERKKK